MLPRWLRRLDKLLSLLVLVVVKLCFPQYENGISQKILLWILLAHGTTCSIAHVHVYHVCKVARKQDGGSNQCVSIYTAISLLGKKCSCLHVNVHRATYRVSLVPSIHGQVEGTPGFNRLCMCEIFPEIWETVLFWHNRVILVFFSVMATCSDRDDKFSSALILRIIYTDEGYSDWKPWINDHVVIVLLFTP